MLERRCPEASYFMKPCPLFVPLAEEGWLECPIASGTARNYLLPLKKKRIDTLILGCTHYPLLQKVIADVMGAGVRLVDSAIPTAQRLKALLKGKGIYYPESRRAPIRIHVTDYVRNFTRIGEAFLGEELKNVRLVKVP
ncbi:MAG: Glutamate racemase [Candidatus Omnitrophica bacterium ADurb.Bin277]|nr:MAG: Glutamate racemase [Candidatus Omnitrophica bacterium ADurb.Bin277]